MLFSFMINSCYSAKVVILNFCITSLVEYVLGKRNIIKYLHNKEVVDNIERDYGENIIVERIPFNSTEGKGKGIQSFLGRLEYRCG